jgi:hypothetical protein
MRGASGQERLKQEVERLRRELAERDPQIAEQARQIAEAEKQIADLERQLALRQQNSTRPPKPPRRAPVSASTSSRPSRSLSLATRTATLRLLSERSQGLTTTSTGASCSTRALWAIRIGEVPFGLTGRGDVFGTRLLENLLALARPRLVIRGQTPSSRRSAEKEQPPIAWRGSTETGVNGGGAIADDASSKVPA